MKANRKFVQADDAVSPVIAVILMVAITVVLAATVFVLVSDIGAEGPGAVFKLDSEESDDQLKASSADSNADWNALEISADYLTIRFNLNANANATLGSAMGANGTFTDIVATGNPMSPGEYIDLCSSSVAAADVKITVRNIDSGSLAGDWTFASIAVCS